MKLPAYYPDTPEVRRDLANYYDLVTAVDYKSATCSTPSTRPASRDNTVVLLTGDHGRGLPRSKRWVYEQGIHVPLIVRWPGKLKPGSVREDLVCFLDFAPTMLALAGAEVPKELQGQVFLGRQTAPERKYIFARPRPHGRDLRPHPHRPRQALSVHPQLPPGAAVRPAHRLHGRDADDASLAATRMPRES